MEKSAVKPEIFRYLDYREYLKDTLRFLAETDRKYSQRWLAQKAGWKSPQLFSMILKGQRKLSIEHAQLLSFGLKLTPKEEEYLLILVELETAAQSEKQLEILDRIRFQFQNGFFKELPAGGMDYLKKWIYPATREFCSLKNFDFTPAHIAKALDVSEDEAADAMQTLTTLKLIRNEKNRYVQSEPSLRATDYISPLVMAQYHMQILEKAFQAIRLKRDFRHFESLVIAISMKDMETFRDKIKQFIREMDMIAESSTKRDDVFQLSLQFFSITSGRIKQVTT